jgi:small GTP-binding protein
MDEKKHKIVMLGNFSVGKTSLTNRFVHNVFDEKYVATIGVRVSKKVLTDTTDGREVRHTLLLWDINGAFGREEISAEYARGAAAAVVVADARRAETLANVSIHLERFLAQHPDRACLVAVNKVDLLEAAALRELKNQLASESWGTRIIYTSALTGEGVDTLFTEILNNLP